MTSGPLKSTNLSASMNRPPVGVNYGVPPRQEERFNFSYPRVMRPGTRLNTLAAHGSAWALQLVRARYRLYHLARP